ncbi:VOC family protein [Chitinophaga sp. 212800010-3]|uniref:VOC family protein n=1 Tax=unclassified Chitinophaga TaxID=2619133 RepID=UPI002DEE6710|nr:2-polyprenyl-6-hydroxyphenol methylase [Chitinophaga sp. 212800010-3]
MQKFTPCLWFDNNAEEAIDYYLSVFKNGKVVSKRYYDDDSPMAGVLLVATISLDGQEFVLLNGGPVFHFTEAISFVIDCADQQEVDYYWNKLIADGGEPSMCGWLKDKYGLSWQVTPRILLTYMNDSDKAKAARVMAAMMKMSKIEIPAIEAAYAG